MPKCHHQHYHPYNQNARCDLWDYMSGVEVSGTGVLLEHQWKGGIDIVIIIMIVIIFVITITISILIISSIMKMLFKRCRGNLWITRVSMDRT